MGIMDMIRKSMRSFLKLEQAQPNVITITEAMTFEDNAAKNQIWYRGDSYELDQLYKQLPHSNINFWGATSTPGQEIRKIHTGIPGLIVDRLVDITLHDMNDLDFAEETQGNLWEEIAEDSNFHDQLQEAIKDSLVMGDGAFRISFDPELTALPIVEWFGGDRIEIIYNRGRLKEVIFRTHFTEHRRSYLLEEIYGYGSLTYKLYRGETELDMSATEYTANLVDVEFDKSVILCLPFKIYTSPKVKGRGQSIYDRKTDAFDSLDESWSQWMDALRSGRSREYIPENLLPRDPYTGEISKGNPFDHRFIKVETAMGEDAKNTITLQQANIPHESYLSTYVTALDLALQGIISPSTLGIDVKKLDNAEAQREKEKATLYTRNAIVTALQDYLPKLISMVLNADSVLKKNPLQKVKVDVPFGEYANPSFESQVETVSKAKTGGIMSIEASVEELYGDSKDQEWKDKEVARIKVEQGVTEVNVPSLNEVANDFEIEKEAEDAEDGDDRTEDLSHESEGSAGTSTDSER